MNRPVILLFTTIGKKLREWQRIFHRYNIDVLAVDHPSDHNHQREAEALLRHPPYPRVLAVCDEFSNLTVPGSERLSVRQHLDLVDHLSILDVWMLRDGQVVHHQMSHRTPGYIDRSDGQSEEDDGWWDPIFRVHDSHLTYPQMRAQMGSQVTSRDRSLSDFIMTHLQRRAHADFRFAPINPERTIDFGVSVCSYIAQSPYFTLSDHGGTCVENLIKAALSRGVHFRAARTRRERNQWLPGLHGGIPTVQKGDHLHQDTFLAHDLLHQLIPDLAFTGPASPLHRRVYLIARMISEAVTLVLADMLFVDSLKQRGVEYAYDTRRIYPLFEMTNLSLAILDDPNRLEGLLYANVLFALTGNDAGLRVFLPDTNDAEVVLERYTQWYAPVFVKDYEWSYQNWRSMTQHPATFAHWWQSIQPVLRAGGVDVLSLDEVVDHVSPGDDLVHEVFTILFDRFIRPHVNAHRPLVPDDLQRKRAFMRWSAGQLMLQSRYRMIEEVAQDGHLLVDFLIRHADQMDLPTIARARAFFERSVDRLRDRGFLSEDDAALCHELVPHVDPYFVSYNDQAASLADVSASLIGTRMDEREPGVALVILTEDADQSLCQRKDLRHPDPRLQGALGFFGGTLDRLPSGDLEEPRTGLTRELTEEIHSPHTVQEMLARARYHGRMRLPGNQYPGEYDLYVFVARVDHSTYARWHSTLKTPGVVQEGMVASKTAIELQDLIEDTNLFVGSADRVFAQLLFSL